MFGSFRKYCPCCKSVRSFSGLGTVGAKYGKTVCIDCLKHYSPSAGTGWGLYSFGKTCSCHDRRVRKQRYEQNKRREDRERREREYQEEQRKKEQEEYEEKLRKLEEQRKEADREAKRKEREYKESLQRQQEAFQRQQREHQNKMNQKTTLLYDISQINAEKATYVESKKQKKEISDVKVEELNQLTTQIQQEEKEIESFMVERTDSGISLLTTISITGYGKSTFCNRFTGDDSEWGDEGDFKVGNDIVSETSDMKKKVVEYNNIKYCIVDTPGADDSEHRDRTFTNKLGKYLKGCGGINAFLVFFPLVQSRLSSNIQSVLKKYQITMGGKKFWKHVIFVFTKQDAFEAMIRNADAEKRAKKIIAETRTRFELNEYDNDDEEFNVKYICIGKNNYKQAIEKLLTIVNNDKYKCDAIYSPYDELKEKYNQLNNEYNDLVTACSQLQNKITNCDQKIGNKQRQIQQLGV